MGSLTLELDPTPGYRPDGPTGVALEVLLSAAADRSVVVIDALVGPTDEIDLTASMDTGPCTGEWCAASRIEEEQVYVVLRELGGATQVTRSTDGTRADGEAEAWGHRHRVDVTLTSPWRHVSARWKQITGTESSRAWSLTLVADHVVVTRRAWSWLLDVDAPEGVLDDVRRRFPEWRKGRDHRVACIVVDVASQDAQDDDSISRGRDVLETAGWTDLRAVDVKHAGARATWWPWPDRDHEMVVLFAGTVPATGGWKYAYRCPAD